MKTFFALLLFTLVCISGCAVNPPVSRVKDSEPYIGGVWCSAESKMLNEDTTGSEQYRVFKQADTGFHLTQSVVDEITEKATNYCERMNKSVKVLTELTAPGKPGCFTSAELIFVCLPKTNTSNIEDPLYVKLTNLKKLLDDGTISKDEFEQQKTKILNQK